MNNCQIKSRVTSLPGADIFFADSISELHDLSLILLSNEWDESLLKVNVLRRILNNNIYDYLDIEVNKRVLPNLLGTIESSGSSFFSFRDRKLVGMNQDKHDFWVLLPSRSWFKIIHLYIKLGFRKFAILPSLGLIKSVRSAITSQQNKMVFLPNYKVMYSSIRDFMRNELKEFDKCGAQSGALNRLVDMTNMKNHNYFRFSVVRSPWKRAQSAFMDKIGRDNVRKNEEYFTLSVRSLMQVSDVTFSDYVKVICKVPDSHSDPHWLSQYGKLYDAKKCLVDYIGLYEKKDELISTLCKNTNLNWDKLQNINPGPIAPEKVDLYKQCSDCYDLIAKRYNDDIISFGYNVDGSS